MIGFIVFTAALVVPLLIWGCVRGLNNFSPGSGNLNIPASPTPVQNSSADVAAATATATLPAAAGKTTYIEGFDLTGGGATAASIVAGTITGLAGGTMNFDVAVAAGVAAAVTPQGPLSVRFPTPIPASALNTAIVVSVPSLGSGNAHAVLTAYGFQA
jgi:hypothetical protein